MKLTKVNNVHVAVSRQCEGSGRGILYPIPNQEKGNVTDNKILERVEHANKLYHAFFRYDIPEDLEHHFREICKIVASSGDKNFIDKLIGYEECTIGEKNWTKKIEAFSYNVSGKKDLNEVMRLHVQQRMTDMWRQDDYCQAAAAVLKCICSGKNYQDNMRALSAKRRELLLTFRKACKEQGENDAYVDSTADLEDAFSLILETVAMACAASIYYGSSSKMSKEKQTLLEKNLEKQIALLGKLEMVSKNGKQKNPKSINLKDFKYPYADDDRMNAILVRMRKALKKGELREIAVRLLQATAQMNGQTLETTVKNIWENDYAKLKKFILAVNKDYHKTHITMSIKNIDVKVQPHYEPVDLSSEQDEKKRVADLSGVQNKRNQVLDLSSVRNHKKQVLNETLKRYASSKEDADEVLLSLKGLLFEYFLIIDGKECFLTKDRIWEFPIDDGRYFDSEFLPFRPNEENVQQATLEKYWQESPWTTRRKDKAIKKRIGFVNYGKYLNLTVEEDDAFRKYWFSFIKDYIESSYVTLKL